MRIITGSARGTKLYTLDGEATRPTAERTKEALFSMIQFDIEGRRVLDLFGGSGQLSLEALSRGAAHAVICDSSREAVGIIRKNAEKTRLLDRCTIITTTADAYLGRCYGEKFDIVFLDPPYAGGLLPRTLALLLDSDALKPTSKVICESGSPDDVFGADSALASHFSVIRSAKYGAAYLTILKLSEE